MGTVAPLGMLLAQILNNPSPATLILVSTFTVSFIRWKDGNDLIGFRCPSNKGVELKVTIKAVGCKFHNQGNDSLHLSGGKLYHDFGGIFWQVTKAFVITSANSCLVVDVAAHWGA
jgi:hypothetical protein